MKKYKKTYKESYKNLCSLLINCKEIKKEEIKKINYKIMLKHKIQTIIKILKNKSIVI
jgi:hypothetical protein